MIPYFLLSRLKSVLFTGFSFQRMAGVSMLIVAVMYSVQPDKAAARYLMTSTPLTIAQYSIIFAAAGGVLTFQVKPFSLNLFILFCAPLFFHTVLVFSMALQGQVGFIGSAFYSNYLMTALIGEAVLIRLKARQDEKYIYKLPATLEGNNFTEYQDFIEGIATSGLFSRTDFDASPISSKRSN